jgi:hypothetical protein
MKIIFFAIFSSCSLISLAQKVDTTKTHKNLVPVQYLAAYDFTNHQILVPYTETLKNIISLQGDVKECATGKFTDSATNAYLSLPDPGRAIIANDLTEGNPGTGNYTIGSLAASLDACVSGSFNPRYFNPGAPMQVYYGRCFSQAIGKIRGCQTAYGWRIEGDMNMDGNYESVMKITNQ